MGPFTTKPTAEPPVVAFAACKPNESVAIASTMASTTGKYSGRQPAMTALMATCSTVTSRWRSA